MLYILIWNITNEKIKLPGIGINTLFLFFEGIRCWKNNPVLPPKPKTISTKITLDQKGGIWHAKNSVKSFNSIEIRTKDIVNAKVLHYRSNSFIKLKFKVKDKPFSVIFNFVVMKKTSFGDFSETARLIKEILKEYDVTLV